MIGRIHRLFLTLIAKKYVAWAAACAFLYYEKITGTDWVMLTAATFAIDAYTKGKAVEAGACKQKWDKSDKESD